MIVLLLLYAITQSAFGDAIPISSIEPRDPPGNGESIPTRTISNIVWSCLSTIFLCTWGSLHPNISSIPKETLDSSDVTLEEPNKSWHDRLWKSLVDLLTDKNRRAKLWKWLVNLLTGKSWRHKLWKWLVDDLKYKLLLFLTALLVPEYILAWAIRQYITAGYIRDKGGIFILCC
jgi:hypothetical protein